MSLSAHATIKLRAAPTLQEGLRFVVTEVLDGNMFFDPKLLDIEEFWKKVEEAIEIDPEMEEAFKEKDPIKFQPFLEQYQDNVRDWYGDNYLEFLELAEQAE